MPRIVHLMEANTFTNELSKKLENRNNHEHRFLILGDINAKQQRESTVIITRRIRYNFITIYKVVRRSIIDADRVVMHGTAFYFFLFLLSKLVTQKLCWVIMGYEIYNEPTTLKKRLLHHFQKKVFQNVTTHITHIPPDSRKANAL